VAIEVGPLSDPAVRSGDDHVGLALLDMDSIDAASSLMGEDPIVRAGVCSVRLYSWSGSVAEGHTARGWPLTVTGDALTAPFQAPTAPAPPWHLHAFTATTALGVATAPPGGATRWRFTPHNSSDRST